MTLLHVYFHLRNQQAFQRLLERDRSGPFGSAGPSTSATKSSPGKLWSRKSIASTTEVNAFDDLGRTVLHLVCSSTDASSTEYARMLLSHPNINVNLPDKENHWTALHRALILLLKHLDVDMSIKDFEGYTAFDLYNSTVWATKPLSCDERILADLFTWGTNRWLGLGDANDHVTKVRSCSLEDRFATVRVCDVKMSKLHTVILTSEPRDNLWVCGFGSGGRLGPSSHTVYTPSPITFPAECSIVSVALGQDHTLALTDAGEVLSWGLNRFSQLGYAVETGQGGFIREPVQSTPRKISQLKKEFIKGIAACKSASACWSNSQVWTWGTNNGQLGYDKAATPVQVFPRQVSAITEPVFGMAMSETATACLFVGGEVVCIWHGGMSKVNLSFPSEISVYRPPRAIRGAVITKIASCEDSFVALSSNGEVFTFFAPTVSELDGLGLPGRREKLIKPQRVWALRRQAGSVRDVDIGADGTFIVCTRSGHVYVRSRSLRGNATSGNNRSFKFQRVPHIQRVVAVCANSTGSFGALRVEYKPPPIQVTGRSFEADMTAIMPFVPEADAVIGGAYTTGGNRVPANDEMEDAEILDDISSLGGVPFDEGTATTASPHDADIVVCVDKNFAFPTHRLVLAARCRPLREILSGNGALKDKHVEMTINSLPFPTSPILGYLHMTGVNPLSVLILLHYLYSDNLLALWDRRIGLVLAEQCKAVGVLPMQIKYELVTLAGLLELPQLAQALRSVVKCAPSSMACAQYRELFDHMQYAAEPSGPDIRTDPLAPDVVYTHSVVLRARCPFFSAFFGDKDWTSRRRNQSGVIDIRMDHFDWEVMQFVLGFICFGEEKFFDALDFLESADDVVEFMFRIVAAANELLLDRLVLLCSQVILGLLNPYNACYLLTDAIYYNAVDLVKGIENYMTVNLEMFLESRILDDLGALEVRHLAGYTRSEAGGEVTSRASLSSESIVKSCLSSKWGSRDTAGDDLFIMDDMDVAPTLDSNVIRPSLPASPVRQYATLTPRPVWKTNPSTPRYVK
ncbi:regulator of chromosome condensation 1/beta-lactamase-inhibitor protein II [Pisolithus thermaeus]|nr:regulator of chromosome condensation 1/beta-lactamase-inhibitor protein II [Pisolithus thermaeus]